MNDQTTAFRNDVLLAESVARSVDPKAIVFKLVNPVPGQDADVPYATRENIAAVLKNLAALARPQDKVMVLLASHGADGFLSVQAGKQLLGVASVADLGRWLEPLGDRPTLLVISACHSGSFIDPLRRPNRIILAAAAKDRSSFGCQPKSDNTFFIKELLRQPTLLDLSTRETMRQATVGVTLLEARMKRGLRNALATLMLACQMNVANAQTAPVSPAESAIATAAKGLGYGQISQDGRKFELQQKKTWMD